MTEFTQETASAPETQAPVTSDIPAEQAEQQGAPDTPETEVETDEQKNAREVDEKRKRDERKAQGLQRRFDELTAEKYAAREAAAIAQRQAQELNARLQMLEQGRQNTQQEGPPQRSQFNDYEDFIEAKSRYAARQESLLVARYLTQGQQQQIAAVQAAAQAQSVVEQFASRMDEYQKATPDFKEVVDRDDVFVPDHVAADIVKADNGPAIMYAIGKDPSIVDKLARLDPFSRAVQIGKLSAMLGGAPKVSNAPAPGKPVGVRPGTSASDPPTDPDAYMSWARKNMR